MGRELEDSGPTNITPPHPAMEDKPPSRSPSPPHSLATLLPVNLSISTSQALVVVSTLPPSITSTPISVTPVLLTTDAPSPPRSATLVSSEERAEEGISSSIVPSSEPQSLLQPSVAEALTASYSLSSSFGDDSLSGTTSDEFKLGSAFTATPTPSYGEGGNDAFSEVFQAEYLLPAQPLEDLKPVITHPPTGNSPPRSPGHAASTPASIAAQGGAPALPSFQETYSPRYRPLGSAEVFTFNKTDDGRPVEYPQPPPAHQAFSQTSPQHQQQSQLQQQQQQQQQQLSQQQQQQQQQQAPSFEAYPLGVL